MFSKTVLVGILKDKRDLNILLKQRWYRIPVFYSPKRKFSYVAFYQPSSFGRYGGRINYYARVKDIGITKRKYVLSKEYDHPKAEDDYYKIKLYKIQKLLKPILNKNKMRVSFGFTTLKNLQR